MESNNDQMTTPLKMQALKIQGRNVTKGEPLNWTSAAENGIEVTLLDDDFSSSIDGSGYIYKIPFSYMPSDAKKTLQYLFNSTMSEFF